MLLISRAMIVSGIMVTIGLFLAFLGSYTTQRMIWSQKISITPRNLGVIKVSGEPYSYLRGSLSCRQSNCSLSLVDANTGEVLISEKLSGAREFYITKKNLSKIYILLNSNSVAELNLSAYQNSEPYAILGIPAFILTFAGIIIFLKRMQYQASISEGFANGR